MSNPNACAFQTIYLKPGEVRFTDKSERILTVLGSCVCITMHNPLKKISAISHAVMPTYSAVPKGNPQGPEIFHYVDTSTEWMIDKFRQHSVNTEDIEIKLFGGSSMFPGGDRASLGVGSRNVDTALRLLECYGLHPKAWNVGGNSGRKLIFNTYTGNVFTKFISKSELDMTLIDIGRTG